jgi:hypothetical protein
MASEVGTPGGHERPAGFAIREEFTSVHRWLPIAGAPGIMRALHS